MTAHIGGYLASGDLRRRMGSGVAEIVPHQAFETAGRPCDGRGRQ